MGRHAWPESGVWSDGINLICQWVEGCQLVQMLPFLSRRLGALWMGQAGGLAELIGTGTRELNTEVP